MGEEEKNRVQILPKRITFLPFNIFLCDIPFTACYNINANIINIYFINYMDLVKLLHIAENAELKVLQKN